MTRNRQLVTMMLWAVAACQNRGDTRGVPVEANDLGITHVEIQHGEQNYDRMLTIYGLDANDQEIAVSTLRTGMVLYTPEPDLIPAGWSAGTDLEAAVGTDTFSSITPDRDPHVAVFPAEDE